MTKDVHIAALCHLDQERLTCASKRKLPMTEALRWADAFDKPFPSFRRLDGISRAICIATEALELDLHLPMNERADTALLLGTAYGCLDADLQFEQSLAKPLGIKPAIFPYTLPSTCLGEAAIRHKLLGGTTTHSTLLGQETEALLQAHALVASGEALAAIACLGDWLPQASSRSIDVEARTEVVAILLRSGHPTQTQVAPFDCIARDPFGQTRAVLNAT